MPYKIDSPEAATFCRIRFTGRTSYVEMLHALTEVVSNGEWSSSGHLWDFRDAEIGLSPDELRRLAVWLKATSERQGQDQPYLALLVHGSHDFGMARTLEAMLETDTHCDAVFRCEAEAVAWMCSQALQQDTATA